jgi:hypothetical protein
MTSSPGPPARETLNVIREIDAILREFDSDPGALAAEIARLRAALAQSRLNNSIKAARHPPTLTPPPK